MFYIDWVHSKIAHKGKPPCWRVQARVLAFELRYGLTLFRPILVVNHSCKFCYGLGILSWDSSIEIIIYRIDRVWAYVNLVIYFRDYYHCYAHVWASFRHVWSLFILYHFCDTWVRGWIDIIDFLQDHILLYFLVMIYI